MTLPPTIGIVRRMIVYGGSPTLGGAATDAKVYLFTFSGSGFASGAWSELPLNNGPPAVYDHTMTITPHPWGTDGKRIAWVFGGRIGGTGGTSNVLWQLVLGSTSPSPSDIHWESYTPGGPSSPGPRIGHTTFYDSQSRRLSLFGGSTDQHFFQIENQLPAYDAFGTLITPAWVQGEEEAPASLSGHAVGFDPNFYKVVARIPEIYDPVANNWTSQPLAARSEDYYPLQFLVPRTPFSASICRAVVVGPAVPAQYLDIPVAGQAGPWTTIANGNPGFEPSTGAMYRPGKILVAGGQVPSNGWPSPPTIANNTATLEAANVANGVGWQQSNAMTYPRYFHNLVLLPTGGVLAVGGMTGTDLPVDWNPADAAVTPELWDPGSRTWTSLQQNPGIARNYHSTAILLPDGIILSGGGWWFDEAHAINNPNMKRLQLFCPPYLFQSDGTTPAQRPVINGAPDTIRWRQTFSLCVDDPATINSACLIRPGATTHGFDSNQRFVPLTIEGRTGTGAGGDPKRLFLAAPASPDSAPAGDYLLFVLGSIHGPQVPSIARWVYVRGDGVEWCDVVPPGTITDLAPDIVGPHEIWFAWTATADDGVIPASGPERSFDLRGHSIPLDNPAAWNGAAFQAQDESVPAELGSWGSGHIDGLQPCTSYHFAVRARDDRSQDGGFASAVFQTSCSGGGGGYSARQVSGGEDGTGAGGTSLRSELAGTTAGTSSARSPTGRGGAALSSAGSLQPTTGLLVVETRREAAGAWRVTLHLRETPAGSDPPSATITVEQGGAGGERDTLGRFEPGADDNLLGLCALRERGRLGIPGVYRIEQVAPHLKTRTGDHVLTAAIHSRLGSLGAEFIASGGAVEFALGDSLVLIYDPAAAPLPDAASWYVLVRRTGDAPPIPMGSRRGKLGESLPRRFALHQNRPNPFRGTTLIAFDLPVESPVTLEVFDLLGRRVAMLADGPYPAGTHSVEWDLRDLSGTRVRPGVYAYRLSAGTFRERRKMNVLE